ncbi:hypothetical protein DICVIV_06286 [Dictyocaulus viviparus]|uniref:Uncharacterized protein n=1 Tax=Dictyocaulus viviparus TaxID=29172 RepID=A0A0D8XUW3_DICVI|nr:hypothetical protein DICVIV_06286 [Dictyocaulus viviparus]
MTEEEKQQLAMDRPPKAPAMLDKVNDDESEALYSSMLPVQSLPPVDQCSSVPNQQKVTTPLQQYPGSLKQTTPGSVPSCQMQSQHTPEMQQQTFMSPVMQNMCAQPSSVSSVHSTHNSMELASGAGPSSQNAYGGIAPPSVNSSAAHSDPSTPLRASCQGAAPSFGSPPQPASIQTQTPVQEIRMRTSSDSATQQSSTGTRRSGESSRSKHRSNQQQQLQQHQQQQQHMPTMHPMSFTNPYAAHPQTYASYPAAYPTHFDPTTAGFASANPYWQTGYQHYAAAKAGPSMGSMMPTNPAAFPYPYPNGMNPVNGRSQSAAGTWHRYPQGMPTFGSASGNPTPFPVGPSATDFMFNSAAAGKECKTFFKTSALQNCSETVSTSNALLCCTDVDGHGLIGTTSCYIL